jgi:hypothetical protein
MVGIHSITLNTDERESLSSRHNWNREGDLPQMVIFQQSKSSSVPGGSLSNASLVGANKVNGPSPVSSSTKPAFFAARRSVEKLSVSELAMSTIF